MKHELQSSKLWNGMAPARPDAFTLVELLVVLATVALLTVTALTALAGPNKSKSRLTYCASSMRQVGLALQMYESDNKKLPPRKQPAADFNNPASSPNVLNLLIGYLGAKPGGSSPTVYSCPNLLPNPHPSYAPTLFSQTSLSVNTVPLGRSVTAVRRPAATIIIQEAWSLSNCLWNQPEPDNRTDEWVRTTYSEWHMWASSASHVSFPSPRPVENLSNAHDEGGNLIFVDGHAEYRKYRQLRSGDFGLLPDEAYQPTMAQSNRDYDPEF